MAETVVQPPAQFAKSARIRETKKYRALYTRSISDSDGFWAEQAGRLSWFKKWDKVSRWDFNSAKIEWFVGGKLNASYNCLDRHLSGPRKNKAALVWEGDSPDESRILTYQELHREVCKFANALKKLQRNELGAAVYTSLTHETIFDIREEDTYWCTADIGWSPATATSST